MYYIQYHITVQKVSILDTSNTTSISQALASWLYLVELLGRLP